MEIIAEMPVFGQSGWELLCRSLLLALDKLGVKIQLNPKMEWNAEKCPLPDEDFSRLMRMTKYKANQSVANAHLLHQAPSEEYLRTGWHNDVVKVCISLFETDRCPAPWIYKLNKMTETWVFSEFNRKGWEESGVRNVGVMPFAIDTDLFNPNVIPIKPVGKKSYAFITNGDFTERKFFEGLVEAFITEFSNQDDVCLIFKSHFGGFTRQHKLDVVNRIRQVVMRFNKGNPPRILLLGEKVPYESMPSFYTMGDCFVLISRGEGLGLPYAEALACGVPVIASNWGGHLQFLNESNSYLVGATAHIIDDMEYIRKCMIALNHSWATPNVGSLRNLMRFVVMLPELAKIKGLIGRKDMEKRDWQRVAIWIINRVLELQRKR